MMGNPLLLLAVFLIVAGLAGGVWSWRYYLRPPVAPAEPDPYAEPGSLFIPHNKEIP